MPILKRTLILFIILLIFGCAGTSTRQDGSPKTAKMAPFARDIGGEIEWVTYYEALGASHRTGRKTFLLYFTKKLCKPCDLMERWTFTDKEVAKLLKDFVPVMVNGDIEIQMVQRFKVRTFPMIIFAEAKGKEIDRKAGYRSANFVAQWIKDVKKNRATITAVEKELELDPDNVGLLLTQAQNCIDADELELGLELAEKAAELEPDNPGPPTLFGLYYLMTDELEKAEAALSDAIKKGPEYEKARQLRIALLSKKAELAIRADDNTSAMDRFLSILDLDPENFAAHMGIGRLHMKAKMTDDALAEFNKAASLMPDSPVPYIAIGDIYLQKGVNLMAEQEFLKAIKLDGRYETSYFRLMDLYEKAGRRDEMMKMYEKAVLIEPAAAHNEIAWLMATSKNTQIFDPKAAILHANTAIEIDPRPWYIDTLAEAHYAAGECGLAIAIIKEAMAKNPENMEYYQDQLKKFKDGRGETESTDIE